MGWLQSSLITPQLFILLRFVDMYGYNVTINGFKMAAQAAYQLLLFLLLCSISKMFLNKWRNLKVALGETGSLTMPFFFNTY